MPAGNMALAFGALVAGAVVIDYGRKSVTSGLAAGAAAGAAGTPASSGATPAGSGAGAQTSAGETLNPSGYIDPLPNVVRWERTDQGVDADLASGSSIVAPGNVQIMGVIPGWYAGQPLVWWKLLTGPLAGTYQYVAEQITDIAPVGSTVNQGQPIAKWAASGSGIEYGEATASGETEAMATTGYKEGYATTAGNAMRKWLNALGANAGSGVGLSIGAGADPDDAAAALKVQVDATAHAITTAGYSYTGNSYTPPDTD
jgi:hypothetical protein